MSCRRSALSRVSFVTFALLLSPAPAVLAQAWSAPATLASSASQVAAPSVAANASGRLSAAWTLGGRVQVRVRQGTAWAPAATLSPAGVAAAEPVTAVAPNGDVVVAWAEGASGAQTLKAAFYASGRWRMPSTLVPATQRVSSLRVGFNGSNVAVLVWSQGSATGACNVMASSSAPSGAWTIPVSISGTTGCWSWVRLAVAQSGEALAAFSNTRPPRGGGNAVYVASRSPSTGAWGAPVAVGDATYRSGEPSVAIAENGLAIVTWADAYGPLYSRRGADLTWTVPAMIDDSSTASYTGRTEVAMDAAGNAVVALGSFDVNFYYTPLRAARLGATSNRWALPVLITPTPTTIGSFQIAASPAGTYVVGWVDNEYDLSGNAFGAGVSTLPPGLGWQRTAFRAGDQSVAVAAARGNGAVLWNGFFAVPSTAQISTSPIR